MPPPQLRSRFAHLWHIYLRRFVLAVSLIFATVFVGIIGFMFIADYSLTEAFYMTIITLASVGYGEVKPLDTSGQIFASWLIILNMGIFAYAIALVSSFLIEGDLRSFLKHRNMFKKIDNLQSHTIVCGFGRHGKEIAEQLHRLKQQFVVIEKPEFAKDLQDSPFLHLQGDATHDDLLCSAGILRAKAIIITFGEDAFNVYTVITARQLNPTIHIITRASNSLMETKLKRAGADNVIMSEIIGGYYMATLVHQPQAIAFFNLLTNLRGASIHFREVSYDELKAEYRDKTIRELAIYSRTGANIIGMQTPSGEYVINPVAETHILPHTRLIVLGDASQISRFCQTVMQE
jgi:voltage-gated potassium channel